MSAGSTGYTILKPPEWERISLAGDVRRQVRAHVDRAAATHAPPSLSPDELSPIKARMAHAMETRLRHAAEAGGVDYYFPARPMHGVSINASFLVSTVMPVPSAEPGLAPAVLADLVAGGATRVQVAGTTWARTERVVATTDGELVAEGVPGRQVDYTAPTPWDERLWVLVSFTTLGDGDPDSEFTGLVVEMFDALMTTWRWTHEDATA